MCNTINKTKNYEILKHKCTTPTTAPTLWAIFVVNLATQHSRIICQYCETLVSGITRNFNSKWHELRASFCQLAFYFIELKAWYITHIPRHIRHNEKIETQKLFLDFFRFVCNMRSFGAIEKSPKRIELEIQLRRYEIVYNEIPLNITNGQNRQKTFICCDRKA